jgi:hypothetical protein
MDVKYYPEDGNGGDGISGLQGKKNAKMLCISKCFLLTLYFKVLLRLLIEAF